MDTTPNLALPYLAAAQAQKHVTHNEPLARLDALAQLAVLDKDLSAPPAAPAEGDRYLVLAASPTGAWSGWSGRVARFLDGAWESFAPAPGWVAFVLDEAEFYAFSGTAWASVRAVVSALQGLALLGLGTNADAANPFAAKLNAALWTALGAGEGGNGDLRIALNKEGAGDVLSLVFETGFSGRAEIGLAGDDDVRLRVSADGAAWTEALRVARATGALSSARLDRPTLLAAAAEPAGGSLGQLFTDSTATALKWHTGSRWARVSNFAKFAAVTSFDNYVAADAWTKVQFNVSDANDQGAFLAGSSRFVAPEAGLHEFRAALTYKRNGASNPSALKAQFYRNGAAAGRGAAAVTGALVDGVSTLALGTVLKLAAGDTVEVLARFTGADGYLASADSLFAGAQLP